MSEEKFSQAPWDIEEPVKDDELRYNDGHNYTIWGGHKKHRHSLALVLCNGRPGDSTYPQHYFDEVNANVHLIAAAPEMYALLKMIADPTTFMGAQTCEELRTAIETVLKKARGEA